MTRSSFAIGICAAALAALQASAAGAATQKTIAWRDHASPFNGTTATVPVGWTRGDDSSYSLDLDGPDYDKQTGNGGRIVLLADPIATLGGQKPTKLTNVGTTPSALLAWMRHNRKLTTSAATTRTVGGALKALSVDMHVAAAAGKEDPSCTDACWTYFAFRTGCCYGTDTLTYQRLYLATVGNHVLAISVEGRPRSYFKKFLPLATEIINTLTIKRS